MKIEAITTTRIQLRILQLKNVIDPWAPGNLYGMKARRRRRTGLVQFLLWPAGEQGNKKDVYHTAHQDHFKSFRTGRLQAPPAMEQPLIAADLFLLEYRSNRLIADYRCSLGLKTPGNRIDREI